MTNIFCEGMVANVSGLVGHNGSVTVTTTQLYPSSTKAAIDKTLANGCVRTNKDLFTKTVDGSDLTLRP